jgi:mRNA interferase MazF
MNKKFDSWNSRKKNFNLVEIQEDFYFHKREVWWCAIGVNVGVEADGKNYNFERPVLIIKKFNKDMFWAVPLTSKPKSGDFFYKVTHEAGESWASLSQIKIFSSKRLLRRIGMISESDFIEIQKKLCRFIMIETPSD